MQGFGLMPIDDLAALDEGILKQRAIAATDLNGYAIGDLLIDVDPMSQDAVPEAAAALNADGSVVGLWPLSVIVAVGAGTPHRPQVNGVLPTVPRGPKSHDALVWVLPCERRDFAVMGNDAMPSMPLYPSSRPPKALTDEDINSGGFFVTFGAGGPQPNGRAGLTLIGSSFKPSRGIARVLGLMPGHSASPFAQYRVRLA